MKNFSHALFCLSLLALTACTGAQQAKFTGYGRKYKIELLNCDGTVARSWVSTGKVLSEPTSDGYFFKDQNSGKLIEVSGTIIISSLD